MPFITRTSRSLRSRYSLACLVLCVGIASCEAKTSQQQSPAVEPIYLNGGTLIPELTIGLAEGPDEYLFGQVMGVAQGSDHSILVLDRQAGVVRQYDTEGGFIRTIGERGSGPGGLIEPSILATHPDGRILIADKSFSGARSPSRINLFSQEGIFLEVWSMGVPIEAPLSVDTAGVVHVRIAGTIPSNARGLTRPFRLGPSPALHYIRNSRTNTDESPNSPGTVRVAADGTVVDTVAAPALPDRALYMLDERTGSRMYLGLSYAPFSWWEWSPLGYLVSGVSDEYAITVQSMPGDPLRSSSVLVRRDLPRVPIVEAEKELVRQTLEEFEGGDWFGDRDDHSVKPVYHSVFLSSEGSLWVGLHVNSVQFGEHWREPQTVFDVFEPDGRYVGQVQGPDSMQELTITGETVLTWLTDDLGMDRVVRYRVVWN